MRERGDRFFHIIKWMKNVKQVRIKGENACGVKRLGEKGGGQLKLGMGGGSGVYKGDIGATYPPLESLG